MPPLPPALLPKGNTAKKASESHLQRGIDKSYRIQGCCRYPGTLARQERPQFDTADTAHTTKCTPAVIPGTTYIGGEVSALRRWPSGSHTCDKDAREAPRRDHKGRGGGAGRKASISQAHKLEFTTYTPTGKLLRALLTKNQ